MAQINVNQLAYNLSVRALEDLIQQQKSFSISEFEYEGAKFSFRVPYNFDFRFDGQYYYHENEQLEIYVREKKFEDLVVEFYDTIYCLWTGYAQRDDSELTANAAELKKTLRNMIEAKN